MDRFDEMRSKQIIQNGGGASGSTGYNIFTGSSQPSSKNGIWIKNGGSNTAYFGAYFAGKGDFITSNAFGYLKSTSAIIGQVIVGDYLYVFGTSASTSYKYDLRSKKYVGTLNVPTVTAQTGYNSTIGAVYNPENDCIYVLFRGGYNSGNYPFNFYVYKIGSNTYENITFTGNLGSHSTGHHTTVPLLYENKIYWISYSSGYNNTYLNIMDLETKVRSYETTGYFYGQSIGTSFACGPFIYAIDYMDSNRIKRLNCVTRERVDLGTFGDYQTYGAAYSMYATGSKVFAFFSQPVQGQEMDYAVFDVGTKTVTRVKPNVNYSVASTLDQNVVFDPIDGILYFRTASTNIQAFQMENSPSSAKLPAGTTVVVQDFNYNKSVVLENSSNLQIGVSDVYVVDSNGDMNGGVIAYVGDGEQWRLLKGRVSITFDTGDTTTSTTISVGGTVSEPTMPSKDGYEFVCWTLNGSEYDFSTPVEENITLEARWVEISPTFVEYIESTGTQYIDTGYYVDANFEWQMDFQFTDLSAGMWSGTGESNGASTGICASTSSDYFMIGANVNKSWSSKATTITKDIARHTLDFKSGSQKIDGTQVGDYVFYSTKGQNTFPIGVFCTLWSGSSTAYSNYCKMKIYSCKILNNGTLVRDFKPCHDTRGVYCLYDAVSNRYFYNQGTGSFRGEGWQPTALNYIESTGTQYIDTGILTTNEMKLETEIYGNYENVAWYGGRTQSNNSYIGIYNYNGRFDWLNNSGDGKSIQVNPTNNTWHTISHGRELYIDGVLKTTYNADTYSTNSSLYLFAGNMGDNAPANLATIKMKYAKIYINDTLVRDYIPVKDDSGTACLYDKVSGTYFYNAGTGSFIAG